MSDYIEREAAIAEFSNAGSAFVYGDHCRAIVSRLNAIPAADVREVKRGKWVFDCERQMHDGWTYRQYHCTECGFQMVGGIHNYCPNCGAEMRDKED